MRKAKSNSLSFLAHDFLIALSILAVGLLSVFVPEGTVKAEDPLTLTPSFSSETVVNAGESYSQEFTASGGTTPYTFSSSGSVPGLSLVQNGHKATFSGTPNQVGSFTFTLILTDDASNQVSTSTTFIVHDTTTTSITLSSGHPMGSYMVGFPVWVDIRIDPGTPGSGTPTGSVTVTSGGGNPSCTLTLQNGTARCALFFTTAGEYTIQAAYAGDTYYASSSSSAPSQTMNALALEPQLSAGHDHTCYLQQDGQAKCWGLATYIPHDGNNNPIWAGTFTSLTTNYYQTCGLKTDGTIQCWSDDPSLFEPPAGKFIAISAGNDFACAIGTDEMVHCWGDLSDEIISGLPDFQVKSLSLGSDHACVIRKDNSKPYCWGTLVGQLAPDEAMTSIAAGRTHTCGITTSGELSCWGAPTITPPTGTFVQVGSGSNYSCGLDSTSKLHCWGNNPPSIDTISPYVTLGVGFLHTCALFENEAHTLELACWGNNTEGEAPRLSLAPSSFDQPLALNQPWSQIFTPAGGHSMGYDLSMASGTLPDGLSLNSATFEISGTPSQIQTASFVLQLAEADPENSDLPLPLKPLEITYQLNVENSATTTTVTSATANAFTGEPVTVEVAISESASPVLSGLVTVTSSDPDVQCQTAVIPNDNGIGGTASCALFFGSEGTKNISASYEGDSFFLPSSHTNATQTVITRAVINPSLSAGDRFTCSVDSNGEPFCWGKSESGQTNPPAGMAFSSIAAGQFHACGRATSSQVACWGWNGYGAATAPTSTGFISVGAGQRHSCAIDFQGKISCWGYPDSRTSGRPTGSGYSNLSIGATHSCVLNSSGLPACWGLNNYGQTSVPNDFMDRGQAIAIAAGGSFSCAIHADQTLECWGGNGMVDEIRAEPAGSFLSIAVGWDFACGIRTDNAIVCWGKNASGQLNTPSGAFISVTAGYNHACAIGEEGSSLVCWGSNSYGQAPVLSISTASLTTMDIQESYSIQLQAAGGRSGSYNYQSEGELPPGLTLDSNTGLLQGTTTQAGYFNFTVKVTEMGLQPALKSSFAYQVTVRAPVEVSVENQSSGPEMAGKPVTLKVVVSEYDGDHIGVSPQGQITLKLSDGQSCSQALDSAGQAWCTFFIQNRTGAEITVDATASYAGDNLFIPGDNLTNPLEIIVTPFQQDENILTDPNRTFVHKSDGKIGCFGAHCASYLLTDFYTDFASNDQVACGLGLDGHPICVNNNPARIGTQAGPFTGLAVNSSQICGIQLDGSVLCWDSTSPTTTTPITGQFTYIIGSGNNFCGILDDQSISCWGEDPLSPPAVGQFVDLSMAGDHACALGVDEGIVCWGNDDFGQSTAPSTKYFTQVTVGEGFSCGLEDSGALQCWGDTSLHQADAPFGNFVEVSAAADHACGLRPNLQVTCWGQNSHGEAPQLAYEPIPVAEIPAMVYWEHYFNPQGGIKPYQATLSMGILPKGMELVLSEAGLVLYGRPTQPDDYSFVIRWQDSSQFPIVLEVPIHLRVAGEDLQVQIQGSHRTTALIGNEFTFRYILQNNTNVAVPDSQLDILLTENLDNILVSGDLTCNPEEEKLTCPILNFAGHSQLAIEVTGTVRGPEGETLATAATIQTITENWPELNPVDNQASFEVSTAYQMTAYDDSFDGTVLDPVWDYGSLQLSPSGVSYLGELSNDRLGLTIGDLPPHRAVALEFDLYIIGGWTGINPNNQAESTLWQFGLAGSPPLRLTSFSNLMDGQQSYPGDFPDDTYPAQTGAVEINVLGYPDVPDAHYHFKVALPHTEANLALEFLAENLPAGAGWGLDNVVVIVKSEVDKILYLPLLMR